MKWKEWCENFKWAILPTLLILGLMVSSRHLEEVYGPGTLEQPQGSTAPLVREPLEFSGKSLGSHTKKPPAATVPVPPVDPSTSCGSTAPSTTSTAPCSNSLPGAVSVRMSLS